MYQRVFTYVYMCTSVCYLCLRRFTYVYTRVYTCGCVHDCTCRFESVSAHTRVRPLMVRVYTRVYVPLRRCVHLYVHISMSRVFTCVYVCYVPERPRVCTCVSLCICVYVYICHVLCVRTYVYMWDCEENVRILRLWRVLLLS